MRAACRAALLAVPIGIAAALPPPPAFLLPDDAVPLRHTIAMTIDPAQPAFTGVAAIEVLLKKATSTIWLNGKDLDSLEASVGGKKARAQAVGQEFIGIETDAPIPPGRVAIEIRYRAKLDESAIVGAYRKKTGGEWYAFTSFTPIDARRAFPCFDEPRFKTPWKMTIHVKRADKAFSNGPMLRETEESGGMKAVEFAETKPLPAEVVAFAVGPFDVLEGAPAGHATPIRVITAKGHAAEGRAAAQASVDVLPRLEAYTGIPYPFGKLDHLAVPEFPFGATENPGLIVYKNQQLLSAPGDPPDKARAIRRLESHEIGHQWFGDLVTQASWDDVWLSEGFATWISAKAMDREQPATHMHLSEVVARQRIMATDESARTRPVRVAMNNRHDTEDVYNRLVYNKGAALLQMLEGWLGEAPVQAGLRAYLKKFAFSNATTADLEASLLAAAGVDPAPVMDAFLNHTGVPTVRGSCAQGVVTVDVAGPHPLPVCVRGDGVARRCSAIAADRAEIVLRRPCPAWIEWNAGATGYYRTVWSAAQLQALDLARLTAAERLMLVYDLRAAHSDSALLKKLASDPEPEIVQAAAGEDTRPN